MSAAGESGTPARPNPSGSSSRRAAGIGVGVTPRPGLVRFVVVAFAGASLCGLLPLVGRSLAPDLPPATWFSPAGALMMVTPLLAAWIAGRAGGLGFRDAVGLHGRPNRWWVVSWIAPVLLLPGLILVAALLPGVELATPVEAVRARFGPDLPPDALAQAEAGLGASPPVLVLLGGVVFGLVAGATINGLLAFGEEAGWRGFLPRALADARFWPAAVGSGALWGLWHAPLVLQGYNFPDAPVAGLAVMTVACALLSPPMLWLRGRAGSAVAAALFHGTLNGVANLVFLFTVGGSSLVVHPLGLVACAVLVPINLALVAAVPLRARMRDVVPTGPG